MADDPVTYERRGPVAVVTVDRPDRKNAVDAPTADALADAGQRFADGEGRGGRWSAGTAAEAGGDADEDANDGDA